MLGLIVGCTTIFVRNKQNDTEWVPVQVNDGMQVQLLFNFLAYSCANVLSARDNVIRCRLPPKDMSGFAVQPFSKQPTPLAKKGEGGQNDVCV